MENYSYIRYRNGFLFFTKQISETEEEITMKDFDPYVMEDIFDSLRPILRELKNEINPYLLELKRGVIAATGQACTFGSSRAEQRAEQLRLEQHSRQIKNEAHDIYVKHLQRARKKGLTAIEYMLSAEYEFALAEVYIQTIEEEISSLKKEFSSISYWVEMCDSILEKIKEQRIWRDYNLSNIDSIISEKNNKIVELKRTSPSASAEKKELNYQITDLNRQLQQLSFFSFSKKKDLQAEIQSTYQKIRELDSIEYQQRTEIDNLIKNLDNEITILNKRKKELTERTSKYNNYKDIVAILKTIDHPFSKEEAKSLLCKKNEECKDMSTQRLYATFNILSTIGIIKSDDNTLFTFTDLQEDEINNRINYCC